ncbi:MAG TPA: HAD-IA family hydrolase [Thermoanaerobaculia bacterium]
MLVWPNWARVAGALQARGVSIEAQQLAGADPLARFSFDRAHIITGSTDQRRSNKFLELVLIEAGLELSEQTAAALAEIRAYHRQHNLWEIVPDFVVPALQRLRSAGYKLTVVSNANGTLHRAFDRLGLAPLVDLMLDSEVEGVEKPAREFFERALSRSGASAETTVHVGDLYNVDVTGARGAGLAAILVDEADLYRDIDCPRIRSIAELPELLRQL